MKKATFKITSGLKSMLIMAAVVGSMAFGFTSPSGTSLAIAAPFALVAGVKKKNPELDADEEKGIKAIEDAANESYKALYDDVRKGLITGEEFTTKLNEQIEKLSLTAKSITVPGTGTDGGADKSLDEFLRDQATVVADLQKGSNATPADPRKTLVDALTKMAKEVKDRRENLRDAPFSVELEAKAAVTMTSGNTNANASGVTVPANFMYGVEANPAMDVRVEPQITDFIDNGNTDLPALPYADKLPTEGTMAITAEGALKPLLSVAIERRFSTAFKIAGRAKITEEALDDIPGLLSLINGELRYSHDIAVQNAVYAHVAAFAPAFVAGSLAATTSTPSNYDAVRAAIYAIKIASKGRYIPNAALVNSADVYAMGATKATDGQYVFPPFVLPDGTRVAGVRLVETQDTTNVPAGTLIVGDFRKIKRRTYKPFNLRISQMGITSDGSTVASIKSDYESNMYTALGESRLHLYHHKNDETAFIKSTFSAIKTAIAAA